MAKRMTEARRNELLAKSIETPLDEETLLAVADELNSNPKYSLDVDPENTYNMTVAEKDFTKWYVQHRNIAVAAQLAGISVEDGMTIYRSYACQEELRRIGMAYKLRQLNNSTLTLEKIGSVLTGYVMDQLPEAEQLSTKDKMAAMKMIVDIHIAKQKVIQDAQPIDVIDIEEQVKDMSVDALKTLIARTKVYDDENEEKEALIKQIDEGSMLSNDDLHYLRSLPVDDLKRLLLEKEKADEEQREARKKELKKQQAALKKLTPVTDKDNISGDDGSCS